MSFDGYGTLTDIGSEEKSREFSVKVSSLCSEDVTLCKYMTVGYLDAAKSCQDLYIYPLAFFVGFCFLIVTLIWNILLCFRVPPYQLAPNG